MDLYMDQILPLGPMMTYVFFRITQFPVDSTGVLRALVVANGTDLSIHHVDAILRDEVLVWDPKNGTCLVDPVDPCFMSL